MAEHTIHIGGIRGAYNKVKVALAGLDHSYDKATKAFTFTADAEQVASLDLPAGVTAEAETAASEPEPVEQPPSSDTPAPASASNAWTVEVGIARFGCSSTLSLEGNQPNPAHWAGKMGGDACTVKDATGKIVASWP